MSNDNKNVPVISSPEVSEVPVSLKTWHRPVISRIDIAQTLQDAGSAITDGDTSPSAS